MSEFEDKIREMSSATHRTTGLELEWYYQGYRDALQEAINVYKETTNNED